MNKKAQVIAGPIDMIAYVTFAIGIILFIVLFWAVLTEVKGDISTEKNIELRLQEHLAFTLNYPVEVAGIQMTLRDYAALLAEGKPASIEDAELQKIMTFWQQQKTTHWEPLRFYFFIEDADKKLIEIGSLPDDERIAVAATAINTLPGKPLSVQFEAYPK